MKNKMRTAADIILVVLLPLLMAYALIGEAVHEWLGIVMAVCFVIHNLLNIYFWKGWRGWFRGLYRSFNTIIKLLLCVDMILLPVSGVLMSRHAFPFFSNFGRQETARTLHMLSAYWGFVLMSVHLGMHWNMVLLRIQGMEKIRRLGKAGIRIVRIVLAAASIYGVYAFIHRQIGVYMLLGSHFVFFDYSEPVGCFLADYVSVMVLFAAAAYYVGKVLKNLKIGKTHSNGQTKPDV